MFRTFLTTILFIGFYSLANAQSPVLLRVVKSEQHDTIGCNIVAEITSLVYKQVKAGKIKLWDSPEKEIQITGASLQDIEHSSGTLFTEQEIIYIYEYWSNAGRNLRSVTSGLSFGNKTVKGEEVSYGYVDYKDIQDMVMSSTVKSNANGNFNTTLAYFIDSKAYYYHIIQYGGTVIDNITKSEQLKAEITGGSGRFPVLTSQGAEVPQKLVTWMLDVNDNSNGQKFINSRRFENAVQDYILGNKEVFYNIGGERISPHDGDNAKLKVTRIEVKEVWKKLNNTLQYDPVSITVYVNDSALNEILYRDMLKMDVTIALKSWIDFIKEKEFSYVIKSINSQHINRSDSYLYLKGLQTADWHKITEYVKYY